MINQELYNQIESIVKQKGMILYDIELLRENKELLLRVSIFKKEGVSLDDCETISKIISPMLDVELDSIDSYNLEVSSPGIERILKKPQHFLCSIGQKVEVKLNDKTTIKGILEKYDLDSIEIKEIVKSKKNIKEKSNNEIKTHNIYLSDCKKIKTIFEFDSYCL